MSQPQQDAAAVAVISESPSDAPQEEVVDLTPLSERSSEELRAILEEKQKQQGQWESEVAHAMTVLQTQGNVGMRASLVDAEGYPRNDIDVTAVREARHTVSTRTNDLKSIQNEMQNLLELVFAAVARERGDEDPEKTNMARAAQRRAANQRREAEAAAAAGDAAVSAESDANKANGKTQLADVWGTASAVCIVRDVSAHSPSHTAGFIDGDSILALGRDAGHALTQAEAVKPMAKLEDFAAVVRESEGVPLRVIVRRLVPSVRNSLQFFELSLVPQRWSGQGLVGCGFDRV